MTHSMDSRRGFSLRDVLIFGAGVLLAVIAAAFWIRQSDAPNAASQEPAADAQASSNDLVVPAAVRAKVGVEITPVAVGPRVERLETTGIVEAHPEQVTQVTPLVAGRVERVAVSVGDRVQAGAVLFTISSPQVAELQGNLRAAEAKLTEAEALLARTKQLVELGASAGKDLLAAETEQRSARARVTQLRASLRAFGGTVSADTGSAGSAIVVRAPSGGIVLERAVNPGAWIEAGASLMTIANLTTVWVMVDVPETKLPLVRVGTPVRILASTLELSGTVTYVDPQINAHTRTARVRTEVTNNGGALKLGMFVKATLESAAKAGTTELRIPSEAVQRIGDRTVVFLPGAAAGRFEVRDIELGDDVNGSRVVLKGLTAGDRVVTKGGFTLKSQLLKGQFGEEEEIGQSK